MTSEELHGICDEIMEGKSLRSICKIRELSESNVRRWIAQDADAMAHSAHARELGCDALADECVEIADNSALHPADRRIKIETRLKLIGKWSQRYSDKVTVKSESTVTHRYDLDSLDTTRLDELEAILADAQRGASGTGAPEPVALH